MGLVMVPPQTKSRVPCDVQWPFAPVARRITRFAAIEPRGWLKRPAARLSGSNAPLLKRKGREEAYVTYSTTPHPCTDKTLCSGCEGAYSGFM